MIRLLVIFLFVTLSVNAFSYDIAPFIQRYTVVGSSDDGRRLAVMLTHFGPSSGAPFANLLVLETGASHPIYKANAFAMEGDENTLALIASNLFLQNKRKLRNLKINFNSPKYSDANYFLDSSSNLQHLHGILEIENVGLKKFLVENTKSNKCSASDTLTNISLESKSVSIEPLNLEDCLKGPIQLRTIIRTSTSLWFFVLRQANFLDIPFYLVEIGGIAWE